ncbi:potassium-transporting ATPase subunit F [Roseateles puraquae]|jgi:K+-transporting ATPase KdpF subunit|nr:potassium-transporting ATPase subunit F [Roseateles puraquae]MBL8276178.1 potassium-transporting ATPase subunit F [Roseateles sp.]MCF8204063.1 potassium-transporting ATPase subunit F [Methylotenera sp.]MDG0852742.1 potassium-transporting ATPase subunit F [Roseateles puraquae]
MTGFELAATGLVIVLVVYLFWALLFPEDLS